MEFSARVEVIKRLKDCDIKTNLGLWGGIGIAFYEDNILCARMVFSDKAIDELVKLAKEILKIDKKMKKYQKGVK